jgi:hypothetical protein
LRPGDAGIVDNLAVARLAQGDFTAAAAAKRAALALDPMAADCARGFVPLAREDELDALATRFEAILASPAGGRPDGIKALHGLAEIAIRRGDRAGSVARLDAAAALHRCIWPLDPDRHEREFDALRAAFGDPAPMIDRPDPVPFTPVFIIGMPRSGTTLVEQLLTGHPDVAGAGETEALALAIRRTGGLDAPLTQARLAAIRSRYLAAIAAFRPGPVRLVTDKMPLNFRFVGVIAAAFPEARIIHLRRDAAAVCWSCYRACFRAAGLDFTYDQRRLGRYARGYAALMAHWRALLPDRLRMLDYAALTEAPEIEARALCADLGLAWDPAVLDLGRNHRPVRTASACQVRQPIYRGSSRAWRDYAARDPQPAPAGHQPGEPQRLVLGQGSLRPARSSKLSPRQITHGGFGGANVGFETGQRLAPLIGRQQRAAAARQPFGAAQMQIRHGQQPSGPARTARPSRAADQRCPSQNDIDPRHGPVLPCRRTPHKAPTSRRS